MTDLKTDMKMKTILSVSVTDKITSYVVIKPNEKRISMLVSVTN